VDRVRDGEALGYFAASHKVGRGEKTIALPPGWAACEQEERRYLDAEWQRLLYVAATRARQYLVVSESTGAKADKNPWLPLLPYVADALPLEGVSLAPLARPGKTVAPDGWDRPRAELEAALASASTPSHRLVSVTELAKEGAVPLPTAKDGKGASWGRVVHRLLEAAVRGTPPTISLASSLLGEEGRPAEEAAEAVGLVEAVLASSLWQRAQASTERHAEVPFALRVDGAELGLPPGEVVLEGVVDLAFREGSGWVLVDYKTDAVGDRLDALAERYAGQIRAYAWAWSRLAGEDVSEALLWFVPDGTQARVNIDNHDANLHLRGREVT
jgi:ATP-dependent helicase/nuclease subunit A